MLIFSKHIPDTMLEAMVDGLVDPAQGIDIENEEQV